MNDGSNQPPVPAAAPAVRPTDLAEYWRKRWLRDCEPLKEPTDEAIKHAMSGTEWLPIHNLDEACEFVRHMLKRFASPEPATQGAAKPVHTDHPFQHWDRTCPACVLEASPPVPNSATQGAAEPVKYTRDFGDYATEDVMAWIDAELARCDAPMGEGLPYIPADKDAGDALRWLRANLFGISAASPAPEPLTPAAGVSEWQIERLQSAIEGECYGLAIDKDHARAILEYVLSTEKQGD